MKHCSNCRKLSEDDALYCTRCGASFEEEVDVEDKKDELMDEKEETKSEETKRENSLATEPTEQQESFDDEQEITSVTAEDFSEPTSLVAPRMEAKTPDETDKQEVSFFSTKKKQRGTWIVLGIVLLCMLVAGYQQEKYNPTKQVEAFMILLEKNEAKKLATVLKSEDKELHITEDTLKPFFLYLKKDKSSLQTIRNELMEQAYSKETSESTSLIHVKKKGKFQKMEFYVQPVFISIEANKKNTRIAMDNQQIVTTNQDKFIQEFGPFVPGIHTFKATIKEEDAEWSTKVNKKIIANREVVNLNFVSATLRITSNVDNAHVFLDEKEVGKLANGMLVVGPMAVRENSVLYLVETKTGKKTAPISMSTYINDTHEENGVVDVTANFTMMSKKEIEAQITKYYQRVCDDMDENTTYDRKNLADRYFVGQQESEQFKEVDAYIEKYRKDKEVKAVDATVNVLKTKRAENHQFSIDYEVTFATEFQSKTKKKTRMETFLYTDAKMVITQEKDGQIKGKWLDFGDGGKKIVESEEK